MGRHSDLKTDLMGRLDQLPGKHEIGIGMIPLGDRERGDPSKDTVEERLNNDRFINQ